MGLGPVLSYWSTPGSDQNDLGDLESVQTDALPSRFSESEESNEQQAAILAEVWVLGMEFEARTGASVISAPFAFCADTTEPKQFLIASHF